MEKFKDAYKVASYLHNLIESVFLFVSSVSQKVYGISMQFSA